MSDPVSPLVIEIDRQIVEAENVKADAVQTLARLRDARRVLTRGKAARKRVPLAGGDIVRRAGRANIHAVRVLLEKAKGPMKQAEIATKTKVPSGNVSYAVRALAEEGVVQRLPDGRIEFVRETKLVSKPGD